MWRTSTASPTPRSSTRSAAAPTRRWPWGCRPRCTTGRRAARCPPTSIATALAHHEQVIYWKVDTEDWKTNATVASILHNVQTEVDPGAIILMHDGGGRSRATSVLALAVVIAWLRSQGYSFTFPVID